MTLAEFRRAYLTASFLPACREDLIALMPVPRWSLTWPAAIWL